MVRKRHNILSQKDVIFLYKSVESAGTKTPRFDQCELIFDVALATVIRPAELEKLETNQVQKRFVDGEVVWVITGFDWVQ